MSYKDTITLPKTAFPLKGKHQNTDPKTVEYWNSIDLYNKIIAFRSGAESFILHDGPPYANGNIHIGHAMNKILKDTTNKYQHNLGKQVSFVPGWDCHGLPIEWKVEEQYRKDKKDKDENVSEFREACRQYAQKWVDIQKEEFKSLGVLGDWDNPYRTMSFKAESEIIRQFHKMVLAGRLYEDVKPVMWSPVEQTSLAEAEVEYKNIKSVTADVKFPVKGTVNEYVVIWTTTPWTIPANKAVAANPKLSYSKVKVGEEFYWLASEAVESNMKKWEVEEYEVVMNALGSEFDLVLEHPLEGFGERNVYTADFITSDTGTGFVHIAPAHGEDDFNLGIEHGLELRTKVQDNGVYEEDVPVVGGVHVYKASPLVLEKLEETNLLVAKTTIEHEYPHSWRSKKPVIYRTTPQWFISLDSLKEKALENISKTDWFPESGEHRISNMVENRDFWCVSRQRTWGVPLMIFVNKKTRKPLIDEDLCNSLYEKVLLEGCDFWLNGTVEDLLEETNYNPEDYAMVMDVLDVWFDSGTTWAFTLDGKRADLYLEGTDQHRGWFQSSLLVGTANTGEAPYDQVLTHGFVLDAKGKKMSKSEGNVVAPQDVVKKYGVDVLRLWSVTSDYHVDLRIGDEVLKQVQGQANKLRNTIRYCLANLKDNEINPTKPTEFSQLELFVMNRIARHDLKAREYAKSYDYHKVIHEVTTCATFLSNVYFDIRKDRLYCGNETDRNETLWILEQVYKWLIGWLSPVMSTACQEAWNLRNYGTESPLLMDLITEEESSKLQEFLNNQIEEDWTAILKLRDTVNSRLEEERNNGLIKSSLEARIVVSDICYNENISGYEEILMVSDVGFALLEENQVNVYKAAGKKCPRCWNYHEEEEELCYRCSEVV